MNFARPRFASLLAILTILGLSFAAAACGDEDKDASATAASGVSAAITATTKPAEHVTLRLGYFPNITHAQPLVGIERGNLRRGARRERQA